MCRTDEIESDTGLKGWSYLLHGEVVKFRCENTSWKIVGGKSAPCFETFLIGEMKGTGPKPDVCEDSPYTVLEVLHRRSEYVKYIAQRPAFGVY